jgi:hypothetical protein
MTVEQKVTSQVTDFVMIISPVVIPKGFIDSVINCKGSSHLNKEEKPLDSVYIPCVKGISES